MDRLPSRPAIGILFALFLAIGGALAIGAGAWVFLILLGLL